MNCKTKIHIPFHLRSYYPHEKTFQSPGFFKTLRTGAELYTGCSFPADPLLLSWKLLGISLGTLIFLAKDNTFRNRGFFMVPGSPFMASER